MMNASHLHTVIPLASMIFVAGYQVNRIDELFSKVHATARETAETRDVILDIHGKVCGIEQYIKNLDSKLEK